MNDLPDRQTPLAPHLVLDDLYCLVRAYALAAAERIQNQLIQDEPCFGMWQELSLEGSSALVTVDSEVSEPLRTSLLVWTWNWT